MTTRRILRTTLLFLMFLALSHAASSSRASAREPGGRDITAQNRIDGALLSQTVSGALPRRVVSLSPSASEILVALGAGDRMAGITLHDTSLPGLAQTPVVGGFSAPSLERILALEPDMVILAPSNPAHSLLMPALKQHGVPVFPIDARILADAPANIAALGGLMGLEDAAQRIAARQTETLHRTRQHLENAEARPVRAIRFMGVENGFMLVPGDDSFQNEYLRTAGGLPPQFGHKGSAIHISPEQWRAFNPEVIYSCGAEDQDMAATLARPEWAAVDAVKNSRLLFFPCDLVNRAATHYGDFTAWLAAELHAESFIKPGVLTPDAIESVTPLSLPADVFPYIESAGVLEGHLLGATAKSLVIRFNTPLAAHSSLTGPLDGARAVGNHYSAPPAWPLTHLLGFDAANARILALLGLNSETTALLHTGADMAHLACVLEEADGMAVAALVTAGVKGNAMRAGTDEGRYVEPGTINIILLSSRALTPGAMSRALITATEAKTAALEDLDIRSSYSRAPATGTGTDNIIIVGGAGRLADLTGGHARLGELMARATYRAVTDAVLKGNGIMPQRSIFQRLAERGVTPAQFLTPEDNTALEQLLLETASAEFISLALLVADGDARGLVPSRELFSDWCLQTASRVAGRPVNNIAPVLPAGSMPEPLALALNALLTGARVRDGRE